MKKGLLILVMSLIGSVAFAQGTAPKEPETPKTTEKQEVPAAPAKEAVTPVKEEVKAVPSAKTAAKPERVVSNKRSAVKPAASRPARNPRPAARPVRPGRGR